MAAAPRCLFDWEIKSITATHSNRAEKQAENKKMGSESGERATIIGTVERSPSNVFASVQYRSNVSMAAEATQQQQRNSNNAAATTIAAAAAPQ